MSGPNLRQVKHSFLAYLTGDEHKLHTAVVFAEFPRKKETSSVGKHAGSSHSYWNIWNGN